MAIPDQFVYKGRDKEVQFRDKFVMPLLVRLGFSMVVNNHGTREFGRDVIFGDFDRFGHVVYYGMQIKCEASISLADSHSLIQDAEQATNSPFRHPQTGRDGYISCFYVANAGDISEQARENFFNSLPRRGIRDARLLDGKALVLLEKAAFLNRGSLVRERITGLLLEAKRNLRLATYLGPAMEKHVKSAGPFPIQRLRTSAVSAFLESPIPIAGLSVDLVDDYWGIATMINDVADSIGASITAGNFKAERLAALQEQLLPQLISKSVSIEKSVTSCLKELGAVTLT